MRKIVVIGIALFHVLFLHSQGTVFIPKGGLTMGLQAWDGFQRQALFTYHGAIAMEGYKEDAPAALFAQVGLHNRGSSERVFFFNSPGNASANRQSFRFSNLSALFGAKKRINTSSSSKPYYS